ncbi:hypothetical protein ACX0G9_21415 [Flavitalea flava]
MASPSMIHFSIALEPDELIICRPEEVSFEAQLLSSSGALLHSIPVREGSFSIPVSPESLKGKRIVFIPVNPKGNRAGREEKNKNKNVRINSSGALSGARMSYEPVLPVHIAERNELQAIPSAIWKYWCFCSCRVRGRVFNNCNGTNSPVYQARVHICEVEPVWFWINRLPDAAILKIRDSIINPEIILQVPPISPVGPGPVELTNSGPSLSRKAADSMKIPRETMGTMAESARLSLQALPQTNISALHTDSVSLVKDYLVQNYRVLYPWWCYWIPIYWWWWYTCIEEKVVYTNEQGWFDTNVYHNCFEGNADFYFWVEYNINGVWTTVYEPPIHCHTYWDYACGTEVDIYLNDDRIPCGSHATTPGKVVVITTLGNNANVNRVQQTAGVNEGQAPDLGYGYTPYGPFGGSVEPHIIFGEDLIPSGVIYYRWSYKLSTADESGWATLTPNVDRHYFHINPDLSISFPIYNLGPKVTAGNSDLFEIQAPRNPLTNDPWAILDARTDTATAYFSTNQLQNGNVAAAAGLYDLKLELFDGSGNQINLTDWGIDVLVPDPNQPAPFGNVTVNTVAAPAINQILDSNGKLTGFRMIIRVDNNPTTAHIYETEVEGNFAGPCGFLVYADKGTSQADVSYTASHPNGYAYYGFSIVKGSSGGVYGDAGPVPAVNPVHDILSVESLLDGGGTVCTRAAFAENLNVYGTATDGWGRVGYDSGDTKAFALTDH